MSPFAEEFAQCLDRVKRSGDFHASGCCDLLAPGLEVEGVGPIALPVLPLQAGQLIAAAERAPYGRGAQTLIDTQVRRTWQVDADRVRIRGRGWERTLDSIVDHVAEGLGVKGDVSAELYKLLVYDEGAFFVSHRDTEKAAGMFATLVIVLPSAHTGGELLIRHQGRETKLDPRSSDPSQVAFVAFYADCQHEVLPVTSGHRLTLVYNLSRRGRHPLPSPPSYTAEQDRLTALLRRWDEPGSIVNAPSKLIYPLEHAYTGAGLSFESLKGADAARASTLVAAAAQADCDLHLALVTIEESGVAEYLDAYHDHRNRRRGRDIEFEAGEVIERSQTLSEWRRHDGDDVVSGKLPIGEDEVSPPDALDDRVPDEESFEEATGNAGASFERRYRIAALVLWPRQRRLAVINQGGLQATLPYLSGLIDRWTHRCDDQGASQWAQAQELADHMLVTWPTRSWPSMRSSESPSEASTMLTLLHRLGDAGHIEAFLANVCAAGVFDKGDGLGVVQVLGQLPPSRAAVLLQRIVAGNAMHALDACADLLARAATADVDGVDLVPAAAALVAGLPGAPKAVPAPGSWAGPRRVDPDVVVDLLIALVRIAPTFAEAAVVTLLAWPATYAVDRVLVPAVLALGNTEAVHAAAVERLAAACIAHLRIRIGEELAPPADWRRPDSVSCTCAHCRGLGAFLADPTRPTWNFKSQQAHRHHVEEQIRRNDCDVDTRTLRQGSPHTLVCTKNQASYQRRAKQRQQDLQHLFSFGQRWG